MKLETQHPDMTFTPIRNALNASSQDVAWLEHYARHTSEGDHPTFGNFIADTLDALIAVHHVTDGDAEEEYAAAELLVDAAMRLRDHADAKLK